MKKIALILLLAICISSLAGVAAFADTAEKTALKAPDIAYANVSITTNVALLFAVPMDGFTVNADGTADGLKLLVWKGTSEYGRYGRGSADATIEASGRREIAGTDHLIFVYDGLDACEMTDTVYARTVVSDGKGGLAYGAVIDYSIAEWGKNYNSQNAANNLLAEKLLKYGAAMQDYQNYKPNGYLANEAKSLVSVTVISKISGSDTEVQKQVTQLAVAGSTVTLADPVLDGYSVSSWSASDTDAEAPGCQIKVSADTTVTATFSKNADTASTSLWTDGFESSPTGQFKDNTESGKGHNMISGSAGIRVNTGAKAYAAGKNYVVSYDIVEDGANKYLSLSSTAGGAIYANKNGNDKLNFSSTSIAASGALTVKFSLMRNESGKIIDTLGVRLRAAGSEVEECMRIFSTEADGTVNLAKFTSGGTVTTKIGEVAKSGWTGFAIVVDLENLLLYGYMKNASGVYELKAVTDVDVPSNYTNAYAWANKVGKIQWEVAHGAVSDNAWNSIVSETERSYLATLSGDEYKTELFRLAKKYFSVGIDNYEILTGNAVD